MPDTVLSSPTCSIARSACSSIRKRRLTEVSSASQERGAAGQEGEGSMDCSPVTVMKSHVVWATSTDSPCLLTDTWKIPYVNLSRLPMAVVETLIGCCFNIRTQLGFRLRTRYLWEQLFFSNLSRMVTAVTFV